MPGRRWTLRRAGLVVALAGILAASVAAAAPAAQNPWLERRVLNMAHQGGEDEAPSSTLYAFKRARGLGADMLELDVQGSADGQLMVIHDAKVDRTTNGTGFVGDMTAAQIQALDAAHNFVPGRNAVSGLPPESYPLRGVRTGQRPPPEGYVPDDFRIPTLQEVFAAFPDVPINIEIKGRADTDVQSFLRNAELLAAFLNAARPTRLDVIVVSFNDLAVERFHQLAPRFGVAPGVSGVARFKAGGPPGDGVVALQVPPQFGGVPVTDPDFVRDAHARGYAVHVWPSDGEDDAFYNAHLDMCADGIMPSKPSALETLLRNRSIMRPGRPGADPCGRATAGGGSSTATVPACAARASALGRLSRRGRVRLRLRRTGVATGPCEGTATLSTRRRHRLRGGRRGRLVLGRARFVLEPQVTTMDTLLRVSRRGRRLLRGRARLPVVTRMVMRGATTTTRLQLRRPRRR